MDSLKLPWDREASVALAASAFRSASTFTDVTLVADGGHAFPAHQAVLARASTFLAGLFRSHACRSAGQMTVLLPGAGIGAAEAILELLYTGKTATAEPGEVLGLARAMGVELPEEVERGLRRARRKRKKARMSPSSQMGAKIARRNRDGVFECWRCGDTYASQRSLALHSVLCAKATKAKEKEQDEESSEMEGSEEEEDQQSDVEEVELEQQQQHPLQPPFESSEVVLELIAVKEEPLDEDGTVALLETCRFCLTPFSTRQQLLRHLCLHHFRRHLEKALLDLPACPCCGAARFTSLSDFLVHVGAGHGRVAKYLEFCSESASDLECPHCAEPEEDPEALLRHLAEEHYHEALEKSYPVQKECPLCSKSVGKAQFYKHLVSKHFALFAVAPRKVCDQLLRIMTDDMLEAREEYGTNATRAEESLEEEVENPNLICPVCEKSFREAQDLKKDLAGHYEEALGKLFGKELKSCPFCNFASGGEEGGGGILGHIAVSHGQLERVLPDSVKKALANSSGLQWRFKNASPAVTVSTGVAPEDLPKVAVKQKEQQQQEQKQGQQPLPPPPSMKEKPPSDDEKSFRAPAPPPPPRPPPPPPPPAVSPAAAAVVICPSCEVGVKSWCFDRHVAVVHLQREVLPYVNQDRHQCRICHAVLCSNRTAMTHVAKKHGFAKRWAEEQGRLVERREEAKRKRKIEQQQQEKEEQRQRELDAETSSSPAATFGSVPCPMPGCSAKPFHIWSKWKKHLYFHVKDMILAEHPSVDKACPLCPKQFHQRFETLFHIGINHNRIFPNLPPALRDRLRSGGLTVNPNKREYSCPMCTDGTVVVGAYTFKCHLFTHCLPRMKASFLRRGNTCHDCGEEFPDFNLALKHVALEHNRFVEFLPSEVLESIRAIGFFSASKVTAANTDGANQVGKEVSKQAKGSEPSEKPKSAPAAPVAPSGIKVPIPTSKLQNSSMTSAPSPISEAKQQLVPKEAEKAEKISTKESWSNGSTSHKNLTCPVCERSDFPQKVHLMRHLLSVHFQDDFKRLYGHCNRVCPLCECVRCSHTDNLRHIAIVHDKLRTVMPRGVVDRLVAANILPAEELKEPPRQQRKEKQPQAQQVQPQQQPQQQRQQQQETLLGKQQQGNQQQQQSQEQQDKLLGKQQQSNQEQQQSQQQQDELLGKEQQGKQQQQKPQQQQDKLLGKEQQGKQQQQKSQQEDQKQETPQGKDLQGKKQQQQGTQPRQKQQQQHQEKQQQLQQLDKPPPLESARTVGGADGKKLQEVHQPNAVEEESRLSPALSPNVPYNSCAGTKSQSVSKPTGKEAEMPPKLPEAGEPPEKKKAPEWSQEPAAPKTPDAFKLKFSLSAWKKNSGGGSRNGHDGKFEKEKSAPSTTQKEPSKEELRKSKGNIGKNPPAAGEAPKGSEEVGKPVKLMVDQKPEGGVTDPKQVVKKRRRKKGKGKPFIVIKKRKNADLKISPSPKKTVKQNDVNGSKVEDEEEPDAPKTSLPPQKEEEVDVCLAVPENEDASSNSKVKENEIVKNAGNDLFEEEVNENGQEQQPPKQPEEQEQQQLKQQEEQEQQSPARKRGRPPGSYKVKGRYTKRSVHRCPSCPSAKATTFREAFDLCAHVVLEHRRRDLAPSLHGLNGVCPECGSSQRSEERFLVHLFVVHGRMRNANELTEEERGCFAAAAVDRRVRMGEGKEEEEEENVVEGEKKEEKGDEKKDEDFVAAVLDKSTDDEAFKETAAKKPKAVAKSKGGPKWRNQLFESCRDRLRALFPHLGKHCFICRAVFTDRDACLRHVGLRHYRIFELVDAEAQAAILDASPACFPPPDDGDESASCLPCPLCAFKTTSLGEIRTHVVAHFYAQLDEKMKSKTSGGFLCPFSTNFDSLVHLGWEHGKIADFAPAKALPALQRLYSVKVDKCLAAATAGHSLLKRPERDSRVASLEQLLKHHRVTLPAYSALTMNKSLPKYELFDY